MHKPLPFQSCFSISWLPEETMSSQQKHHVSRSVYPAHDNNSALRSNSTFSGQLYDWGNTSVGEPSARAHADALEERNERWRQLGALAAA